MELEDAIRKAGAEAYSESVVPEFEPIMGTLVDAVMQGDKRQFRDTVASVIPGVGPQAYMADLVWGETGADVEVP